MEHNGSGCNMAENFNAFKAEIKQEINNMESKMLVFITSSEANQVIMKDAIVEMKEQTKYLAEICNQNNMASLARDTDLEKKVIEVSYEAKLANANQDLSGANQTVSKFDKIKDLIISGLIGMGFAWLLFKFGIK